VTDAGLDVVVLGGGGHVGLPLALSFADTGWRVGIYDINPSTLDRIGRGEMPFLEHGADDLLRKVLASGRLELSSDPKTIGDTDRLIIVIGTPVDEFLGPSMTIFDHAVAEIAPHLRDGALVVLRSTVYPGTTEYVAQRLEEHGREVDLTFCPERIAEGHALEELHSLPQIIGADDDQAADRASELFGRLARKTIRTTTKEAELAKLFTNTWRYMKFAVANQFFTIAHSAGVDYTNILHAIREDYLSSYQGDRFIESMRYVRAYPAQLPALGEMLPQIRTPVQIIAGRHDTAVPPVNAEFLHDRLPHSKLDILDAGHFTWEDAAGEYAALVTTWWSGGYATTGSAAAR